MDNMAIYEACRTAPANALRTIEAGRLKGKSDINPMWRIKTLTEQFGPCGIGWKYVITKQWTEQGGNGETAAFINIDLFIKYNGEWSEAIPGTGGSSFVAIESKGIYVNDECFKMALTDAISVSCKALGVAADVYWNCDDPKYNKITPQAPQQTKPQQNAHSQNGTDKANEAQLKAIFAISKQTDLGPEEMKNWMQVEYGVDSSKDLTKKQASEMIEKLREMVNQAS